MIVEVAAGFATLCAATFLLPLDRTYRLGIFASGGSALALYVAGRSPRDAGRMALVATVLVATFIACATAHARLPIQGGGAGHRFPRRRGHVQRLGLRSTPITKRSVSSSVFDEQLAQHGNLIGYTEDVPRGRVRDAYRNLQRQLDANLDLPEFDDTAHDIIDFRQKFANLPCTALALNQHNDICWVVSVLDLIYNTPLLGLVGKVTQDWVVSTYIESMKSDERSATCRRLPWHIEAEYAPLASRRGEDPVYNLRSTFESDGGFADLLLFAIFLADGLIVPSPTAVYAIHELAGANRTGIQAARLVERTSAADIGKEIDRALRQYDFNFKSALAILLQFDAPDAAVLQPTLASPWFRELAFACKARGARDVYGGVISVAGHAISFTVCYRRSGEVEIVPRTYGVAGLEAVSTLGDTKVRHVTLVVRTGER